MSNCRDRRPDTEFAKSPREMTDLECLDELTKLTRDEWGGVLIGDGPWLLFGAIRGLAQLMAKRGREEEE